MGKRNRSKMGCNSSTGKDAENKAMQLASSETINSGPKLQLIEQIVNHMDTSADGIMQKDELKIMVKHLDPTFVNTPAHEIQIDDPKILALADKPRADLVCYLRDNYDIAWIRVFHTFLGLGQKK